MADQVEVKKRVARGRPVRYTDKQLDDLAQPTAEDITAAQAAWLRFARPAFANLLLATAREQPLEKKK